jgi:hypothetical protein
VATIAYYLHIVQAEGARRGFRLDQGKIARVRQVDRRLTTRGQLSYEWLHLMAKLRSRDAERFRVQSRIHWPQAHPLFRIVPGDVEDWEKR